MDLRELQREWDARGATNPFQASLTDAAGNGIRPNVDEVFALGEEEISGAMGMLQNLGVRLNSGIALDFGCGVGRLTQAIARRFQSVYGVDIAPSVIDQAKRLSRSEKCHYMVNARDDLRIFPSEFFDFIYTNAVLPYLEPHYSKKYIGEFLRVLKPGGVLVFDLAERLKLRTTATLMDRSAYNAQIRILSAPVEVAPGAAFVVRAVVHNASGIRWPGKHHAAGGYFIRLGNHWLDAAGEAEMRDDGRTALPHDLEPGAEVELTLRVHAPGSPGSFILELDLAHEFAHWFSEAGSATARHHVLVTPAAHVGSLPVASDNSFQPERHSVPRSEAEYISATGGAHLVHVYESDDSDSQWIEYRYVVTK